MAMICQMQARCLGTPMPDSVQALRSCGDLQELGRDFEGWALMGTQLDHALITTRNAGALISGQGGYGPLQTDQMPLRLCQHRVSLRVGTRAALRLGYFAGRDLPDALVAYDRDDQLCHRVQLRAPMDLCVARSVAPDDLCADLPPEESHNNVVSLHAVRRARAGWDDADAGQHLNDFMYDQGRARLTTLPHVGPQRAWQIVPQVLVSFFTYLQGRGISFARMVPVAGLMQADVGPLEQLRKLDQILQGSGAHSSYALDLGQVQSVWVVASARHWQIEIYGHEGRALSILSADPLGNQPLWRDFLLSLPRAWSHL